MNQLKILPPFFLLVPLVLFSFAHPALAAEETDERAMYRAEVTEIQVDGQDVRVKLLEGSEEGKGVRINLGGGATVVNRPNYKTGDNVFVTVDETPEGEQLYSIVEVVRTRPLLYALVAFLLAVLAVGRVKGVRALGVLAVTFAVIFWFVVPSVLRGWNPVMVAIIGSLVILGLTIIGTDGWNRKSRLALLSIAVSLIIAAVISWVFTDLARLTGTYSDEALFILEGTNGLVNMKGVLLAGMILGAIGVLDDVVISQISTVNELAISNSAHTWRDLYRAAMNVGVDHITAIVNTLFLAYAGVSLPLLVLFGIHQEPFLTFEQVVNNEGVATEIMRTLAGSIALVLAVPISTLLAARAFAKK